MEVQLRLLTIEPWRSVCPLVTARPPLGFLPSFFPGAHYEKKHFGSKWLSLFRVREETSRFVTVCNNNNSNQERKNLLTSQSVWEKTRWHFWSESSLFHLWEEKKKHNTFADLFILPCVPSIVSAWTSPSFYFQDGRTISWQIRQTHHPSVQLFHVEEVKLPVCRHLGACWRQTCIKFHKPETSL